ncbi:MAG: ribonuclease H [Bacilli bacterium]
MTVDGGCRGNGKENAVGGYGCYLEYIVDEDVIAKKEIGDYAYGTTNNIMELNGAICGFKAINDLDIEINAYLDSKYVKQGIEKGGWLESWKRNNWKTSQKKDVKNKELWIELDNLVSRFGNIKFHWVKGHMGGEDNKNEIADRICNDFMNMAEKLLK